MTYAHIYKMLGSGWLLELSVATERDGWKVIAEKQFPTKWYAENYAKKVGAEILSGGSK